MEPIEFGQFDLVITNGSINGGATALQWGDDGLLYAVGRNGFVYAIEVTKQTNADGETTGYTGEIQWTHDLGAPNFNDDGEFENNGNRQALGIVVTTDEVTGETIVYVSHSDIKIGAGSNGGSGDVGLDTNSGVITRITLNTTDPDNIVENEAIDLIRGLPRSEENHATNGLELTTDGDGNPILLIAAGGHANAGAPSVNFVGLPEYTHSGAVLSADLNKLAVIEAAKKSVDPDIDHVLDLPTLDDPTRPNFVDSQGNEVWIDANFDGQLDTVVEFVDNQTLLRNGANVPVDSDGQTVDPTDSGALEFVDGADGLPDWLLDQDGDGDIDTDDMDNFVSTKIVDTNNDGVLDTVLYQEGGSAEDNITGVRGGNDGLNQAKLLVGNPVQIFSSGYRNLYDVLKTEDGKYYAYDNGANGGWGGVAVTDPLTGKVTNAPNNVNQTQNFDNLHEFEEGFHAGHPNPVVASGADAGLWTSPTTGPNSSQTLPISQWRELSDTPLAAIGQEDDGLVLPSDWDEVVDAALINPAAGVYNEGGSVADGALDADKGSWNGLAEYTGTAFGGALQGAILVTKTNGSNNVKWIKRDANGNIDVVAKGNGDLSDPDTIIEAADQGFVGTVSKGNTLGIDAVGDGGVDGLGLFNNTIWVGSLGGTHKITVFEAGGEPAGADLDKDDDGIDHILDYYDYSGVQGFDHVLDPQGTTTTVNAGDTLTYNLSAESYPLSGPGGIGQLGFMVNLVDPSAEGGLLTSSDNVIPGGAGSGLQIKDIRSGTAKGDANDQKDALTFAVTPGDDAGRLEISTVMNAILTGFYQDGSEAGLQIGTGDQFSFMSLVLAYSGSGTLEVVLHYEESDTQEATQSIDVSNLLEDVGGVQRLPSDAVVEFLFDVDKVSGTVTPKFRISPDGITSGAFTELNPVQTSGDVLAAIQGDFTVDGVPHPLAFGNIGTSNIAPDAPAGANEDENVNVTYDEFKVAGFAPQVDAFVVLTGGDTTVDETAGTIPLTLELQDEFGNAVTLAEDVIINFALDGTATLTDDFTISATSPVTISAGSSSAPLNVTIVDDDLPEANETIEINLASIDAGELAVIGKANADSATITIDSDDAGNVLYRVNAGGAEIAAAADDPIQLPWAANTGTGAQSGEGFSVNTGNVSTHNIVGRDGSVADYVPQTIFAQERWDPPADPNMTWSFDVEPGGTYQINIFAGNGFGGTSAPGQRVFDIEIEGVEAFADVDLSADFGHQVGGVLTWTGTVLDGSLDVVFLGQVENPTVNGFEVIELAGPPAGSVAEVSVADVSVNEGDGTATLTFELSAPVTEGPVTVPFTLANGTATQGIDFSPDAGPQTVVFDGSQTATATILIGEDTDLEGTETFTVSIDGANIAAPAEASVTASADQGTATVTIFDNDFAPLEPGDVLYRVNTGGPVVTSNDDGPDWGADTGIIGDAGNSPYLADAPAVGTTFSNASDSSYPGNVQTALGDAANVPLALFDTERGDRGAATPTLKYSFDVASDHGLAPGDEVEVRLYFAEIFAGIETPENDADMDGTPAGNRVFDVAVDGTVPAAFDDIDQFASAGANTGFVRTAVVTVDADGMLDLEFLNGVENPSIKAIEIVVPGDAPQSVTVTAQDISADESTGEVTITFSISEAVADGDITVPFTLVDGTATIGVDTTPNQDGSVTFPAGTTSDQTVVITLVNDDLVEADETFTVQLGAPTAAPAGVTVNTVDGTATIENDDVAPVVDSFNGTDATGGDWSNINTDPDDVTLNEGTNTLISTGDNGDADYITFTVAAGQQVTAITLADYVGGGNAAFLGIQQGDSVPTQADIEGGSAVLDGGTVYSGSQIGDDILPLLASTSVENAGQPTTGLSLPLQEGTYTLWFNQNQDLSETTLEIVSEAVATVSPTDIDGDGILNTDDPFAYDGSNGDDKVLTPGGEFTQNFNTDTTNPFSAEGGFTGILVNPAFDYPNASETDPYGDRTNEDKVSISGGTLNVTSDIYDAFPITGANNENVTNNTLADGYQSAVDVSGATTFEVHARASSADWFATTGTTNGFEQFGITLGAGGVDDFVKLVVSDNNANAPRVQIGHNQSLVGGEQNYPFGATSGPSVDLSLVGDIEFRLIVDRSAGENGQIVGQVDFFDADGNLLESFTTPPADILANSSLLAAMDGANPLTGGDGNLAYGIFVTDFSGGAANEITANYDFLTIRSLDGPADTAPTSVTLENIVTLPEDADTTAAIKVADIVVADDALSPVTLTLEGADQGLFEIQGSELFLSAGASLDFEGQSSFDVAVVATDGVGSATSVALGALVTDVNEAPELSGTLGDQTVTVGESVDVSAITATDPDANDTATLVLRSQDGSDAPEGITLANGTITVASDVAAGEYLLEIAALDNSQVESVSTAAFALTVQALPNPDVTLSIADAPTIAEGGDDGVDQLAFAISTTPALEGDVELTYDKIVDGVTTSETATVTLDASGQGTLPVDVAQDDADTMDTVVSIALTGTTTTGVILDGAASTASGTVTDDDTLAPIGSAPDEDLDQDGLLNSEDDDIDGDGAANGVETFRFDATNAGTALAAGESIRLEFDTDGTPFENGLTGALVRPNELPNDGGAEEVDLNNAEVSGGSLNINVTTGDHFSNGNSQQNAFVAAYTAENGLSVETRFEIPDFDSVADGDQTPGDFQATGVVIGVDQNTLVKAVYGRAGAQFELAQDNTNPNNGNGSGTTTAGGTTTPAGAEEVSIRLEVSIDPDPNVGAVATAFYTFYDAFGNVIGAPDQTVGTITLVDVPSQGNNLKTLVESGAPLGAGVIQTSTGGSSPSTYDVSYQYVEVTALEAPPVLVSVSDAAPVEESGDEGTTDVNFALQLSEAAEASLEITANVSINGAEPTLKTFTVAFDATGAGTLIVPVDNDDVDTGDDDITLELVSIETPGFEVDTTADSATGTVTEDDTVIPPAGDVLFRVNVGGPEVAAIDDGPAWTADTGITGAAGNSPYLVANSTNTGDLYDGNNGSAHPGPILPDASVLANTPLIIFNTERSDPDPEDTTNLTYEFPVEAGTTVEVRLFFAELFGGVDLVGERIMDVAVEGTVDPALDNIDQIAIAGPKGAFMRTVQVVVSEDGILDIEAISQLDNQRSALKAIEVVKIADPVDEAPTIDQGIAAQSTDEDALYDFTVPADAFADDGGAENLTLAATLADDTALPAWLSFDADTGAFSGTPENGDVGTVSVKVTATDAAGQSVDALFDLTVNNTNDAPTVESTTDTATATAGEETVIDLAPFLTFDDVDVGDVVTPVLSASDPSITIDGTTVTVPATLAEGSYTITVGATDIAEAEAATVEITLNVEAAPDTTAPVAVFAPIDTITDADAPIIVEVTITDDVALQVETVAPGDVLLSGPGVNDLIASDFDFNVETGVATYTFTPPVGGWENGEFTASLAAASVTDLAGNPIAASSTSATVEVPEPVLVSISDLDPVEESGDVGATALVFAVQLSEAQSATLSAEVSVKIGDGAAVVTTQTLEFDANGVGELVVSAPNDNEDNGAETVQVTILSITDEGFEVDSTAATGSVSVTEDDQDLTAPTGIIQPATDVATPFDAAAISVVFSDDVALDEASIDGDELTISDGTTTVTAALVDFDVLNGIATYSADAPVGGWAAETLDVTLLAGSVFDAAGNTNESAASSVTVIPVPVVVSLVQAGALTLFEENEDGLTLTIQLSEAATEQTTVTFEITGDVQADEDYRAIPESQVTFDIGEDTATVILEIFNDTDFEADEALNLTLTSTTSGTIDPNANLLAVTIVSDDPEPPVTADPIELEAEDFTGLDNSAFFAQGAGDASNNALIRLNSQEESTVSTDLPEGVTPGVYTIAVTYFDESDGQSTASIAVGGETVGSWIWDNDGPGNAAQGENLRTIEFKNILIEEGDDFSLTGLRGDGEFVRVDKVAFIRTGDTPANEPPTGDDIPDLVEVDAGAAFTIPFTFTDPEGGLVTTTATLSDGNPLPDWITLDENGLSGTAPDELTGQSIEVTVTASDPENNSITDTFTVELKDVTPPVVVLQPTGPADPDSEIRVIVDFQDAGALDVSTAALEDFSLTGPDGTLAPVGIVLNPTTLQIEVIFDAPVDGWTSGDYTASLVDGGLSDLGGNASLPSTPVVFAVVGNETDGPTATVNTGGTTGNQEDLQITVVLADETGIDEASIQPTDLVIEDESGVVTPATSFDFDVDTNTVTFTFAVPVGGFAPGNYSVTLVEGAVLDTLGNASSATLPEPLIIEDTSAEVGANLDEDLDDDGAVNSADADIDEDGTANADDRFAYDANDGDVQLSDIGAINIDLAGLADGDSPFKAGFTGVMPAFSAGTVELDYATNNGAQVVSTDNGNRLVVESSATDTNEGEAAFTFGAKVSDDFTLSGTFDNPYFNGLETPETPADFEQYGLIIGIDGGTFVKFVTGSPGADFELSGKTANVDDANPPKLNPLADKVSHAATKLDLDAEVTETEVIFTGTWTTLDADGNTLQTGALAPMTLTSGPIFDAIQAGDTALAFGISHTQVGGADDPFPVSLSELSLTDGNLDLAGPTATLVVDPVVDTNSDIVVTATFADDTGVDPATLDGDEVVLTSDNVADVIPTPTFVDNQDGTATYTFAAPDGGWLGSDFSVALVEASVADTSPAANTNAAGTPVNFTIADPATPGANLDEDFDQDTILNNQDDDIDQDGIANAADRFAYDDTNQGVDLPTVGSVDISFEGLEAGDSPFAAGFTGVNPTFDGVVQELDYATNNGAQVVDTPNGKRLQIESSATDTNNASSAFTFGASVGDEFTFTGKFDNPYFDGNETPENSEQYGIIIATDGGDFLKLVAGSPGALFELSGKTENVGFDGADLKVSPAGLTATSYASVELTIDTLVTATEVIFSGSYTAFDETGGVISTGAIGTKTLTSGELFDAIQGGADVPAFGVTHTQVGGSNDPFTVSVESLSLTDGNLDTDGPDAVIESDGPANANAPLVVTVTYADDTGVDFATIDGDELLLTSNDDGDVFGTPAVVDLGGGAYTYTYAAPAGGWGGTLFTASLAADTLADTLGNANEAGAPVEFSRQDVDPVDDILANLDGVDNDGQYGAGDTGSVILTIMDGVNNVRSSNFGANSFELKNTGDKQVAAVFIDVRDAVYGDSVFDFDGSGGDTAAKPFDVNSETGDGTGALFEAGETYLLPGTQPIPNTSGGGVTAGGGFRGLLIKFDGSDSGFENGEMVGFSGDMDPNSIAGLLKGSGADSGVDDGAIDGWDVGGVSGAELIGSKFTVVFDDGSTATGYLHSDGSLAGSVGEAVEGRGAPTVSVTVDGFDANDTNAVYGGTEPVIEVDGPAGATVRVVLTKGFNPVTNPDGGIADIVANRLATQHPEFEANNAFDVQTVDVVIGPDGTATVPINAFDYNNDPGNVDIPDAGIQPISVSAAVIVDSTDTSFADKVALGPVSDTVYLTNPTGTPVVPGTTPPEPQKVFLAENGTVVFEAESADRSSTNGWVFETTEEGSNENPDPSGEGYIIWEGGNSFQNPASNSALSYTFQTDEGGNYVLKGKFGRRNEPDTTEANDAFVRLLDSEGNPVDPVPQGGGGETILHVKNGEAIEVPTSQFDPDNPPNGSVLADAEKWMKFYIGGVGLNELSAGGQNGDNGGINVVYNLDPNETYTLQVAGRSNDFEIDKLALSNNGAGAATQAANNGAESDFFISGPTEPEVDVEINDLTVVQGNGVSFTIPANAFDDADGDALILTAPGLPSGFTFENGVVTAPDNLPLGSYPITIVATDDDQNSVSQTFNIIIAEQGAQQDFQAVTLGAQDDIELGSSINSNDLETDKTIQIRLTVEDGVTNVTNVESALISWRSDRTHSGDATLTFQVEDTKEAGDFQNGKDFLPGSVEADITGTWQDEATIENVADIASLVNELIASQGPLNGGDIINLQITGEGATRFIEHISVTLDISATGGSTGGGNTPPVVANALPDADVQDGDAVNIDLSNVFSDADNDGLSFSVSGLPNGVSLNNGTISGTPTEIGTFTVSVTANDGQATATDVFVLTVLPEGDTVPTVANEIADQAIETDEAFSFTVPGNAFDDADGDTLTIAISAPAGFAVNGSTVTAPAGLAVGTYPITVTATDDDLNTVSQTFNVTVSEPVDTGDVTLWLIDALTDQRIRALDANDVVNLAEIQSGVYNLEAEFNGTGDESAVFFLNGSQVKTESGVPYAMFADSKGDFNEIDAPADGTVQNITVEIYAQNNGNGPLLASSSFVVTYSEGEIPNRAPVVSTAVADEDVALGAAVDIDVSNVFTDPDNDGLDLQANGLPQGLSFNGTSITGTPAAAGTFNITVTASDGEFTASDTFTLTVLPDTSTVPVVDVAIADQAITDEEAFSLTVPGNAFDDADGDPLTISIAAPAGFSVNGSTVSAPAGLAPGTYDITVTATDDDQNAVSQTFSVTVSEAPPPPEGPVVLWLVDPETDVLIRPLSSTDVIGVNEVTDGQYNIAAIYTGPGEPKSARMFLDGQQLTVQGGLPYALFNDSNGDYNSEPLGALGSTATFSAQVFASGGGNGELLGEVSVTVTFVAEVQVQDGVEAPALEVAATIPPPPIEVSEEEVAPTGEEVEVAFDVPVFELPVQFGAGLEMQPVMGVDAAMLATPSATGAFVVDLGGGRAQAPAAQPSQLEAFDFASLDAEAGTAGAANSTGVDALLEADSINFNALPSLGTESVLEAFMDQSTASEIDLGMSSLDVRPTDNGFAPFEFDELSSWTLEDTDWAGLG
ncbi:MAG: putative Ig domain-containing protein [Pseudomonadota bacterium]